MAQDFKQTMNLPQTGFPMRASLSTREPEWLAFWDRIDVYRESLKKSEGKAPFVLHDGPPYANGHIHMGTAYNKVLKDLIVKYKSMRGFYAPYVPGWDCHGQPIEHQVEKNLGPQKMKETSQSELRLMCREYALKFVDVQREEFKRLGVRGDWDEPYLTLHHSYEAGDVKVFAKMYEAGMIYKGRKPIHWCKRCHTALAEAEIEYSDEQSDSIYVKFRLIDDASALALAETPASVLIWTTTPWTLPANVAVTLADDADYVGVLVEGEVLIMAEALVPAVAEVAGWEDRALVTGSDGEPVRVKGRDLAGLRYSLPVHESASGVIITGEHVELTAGTGAVHTAPGHGEDDYLVGMKFGLPMPMPVDDNGVFDEGGGPFAGMSVDAANPVIIEWLRERGKLVAAGRISHSYPHCWRCKKPVIFRATDQWFVSMDATHLREAALREINQVEWIPGWAINRLSSMIADRPDWCISRQRAWGVPIPVFECAQCGETVATPETFSAVEGLFTTEGADAWFTKAPAEYLPSGTACARCGGTDLKRETDILDVWFESGVSHTSVLETRPSLRRPATMYLEGSDQHRGWFQSSLLTSVGAYDKAPFEKVLTHGFIVDGDGRKMSKSIGNTISPLDIIAKSGADIVRLWVASADYGQDVSVSDEILDRTSEAYRRIRNTFRFLLSNLYDFDATADLVGWHEMPEIDRFALAQLSDLTERVTAAYDEWRFHAVYRALYDYVTELSSVYLDVLKDRLYADAPASPSRRSAQTVLARILGVMVRLLAPVLSFTCEEVWSYLPEGMRDAESVQLTEWPVVEVPADEADALRKAYEVVLSVRELATKAMETARNDRVIGKSQEARIVIEAPGHVLKVLEGRGIRSLAEIMIVADVVLKRGDELNVSVAPAEGEKCPRCWNLRDLGVEGDHPGVCERCAEVLREIG
ncbi:MAG: isoleucine--tRNA ligase [Coriobacteriia bacterium]|nr:isoleucine--tRNA ligase [Coriobacteriia bacterium]